MRSATHTKSAQEVVSFEDILAKLHELDTTLAGKKLHQFLVFNTAYMVVTNVIKKAVDNNQLTNPKFVEAFSACFARYYFRAVEQTSSRDSTLPFAWSQLNKAHEASAPAFILLLMGANAHINYDLPLALVELADTMATNELVGDIIKIDKLLMKSGREIIGLFEENNAILDFLKRRLIFLYYRPVMYLILYWRICAWRSYRHIAKVGVNNSKYERRSEKIANRLIRVGTFLG